MNSSEITKDRTEPIRLTCEICGRVLEHNGEMIFGLCVEHIVTVFDEEQGEAKQ